MKILYWTIFVSCLGCLLLGTVVTYSIPTEEIAAREFAREPEAWNLTLKDRTNAEINSNLYNQLRKEEIARFIKNNPSPSKSHRDQVDLIALIAMIFSLVGWMREPRFMKYKNAIEK